MNRTVWVFVLFPLLVTASTIRYKSDHPSPSPHAVADASETGDHGTTTDSTDHTDSTSSDTSHSSGGHSFQTESEISAFCFLIFFVVFWTVMFELLEHKLKHETPEMFLPVLYQAFSELTVLGFIGVVSMIVTQKYGFLAKSDEHSSHDSSSSHHKSGDSSDSGRSLMNVFSEFFFDDPDHLEHRFHEIHYQIFFLMMSFIGLVCFLLLISNLLRRQYRVLEKCTHEMYKTQESNEKNAWLFKLPFDPLRFLFISETSLSEHQVFRDRFIATCSAVRKHAIPSADDTPSTDTDVVYFDFAEYRVKCIVSIVVKMLKLELADWLTVTILLYIFAGLYSASSAALAIMLLLFAILNLVHVILWVRQCEKAKLELLPCTPDKLHKHKSGEKYVHGRVEVADADSKELPIYLTRNFKLRETPLEKFVFGVPANRHEQLFWGENRHAIVMVGLLRCSTFLTVIQVATAISIGSSTIFVYPFVGVLCMGCYVATVLFIAKGIQEYSLVASIEKMKDVKVAEEICVHTQLKRAKEVWDAMTQVEIVLRKDQHHQHHDADVTPKSSEERTLIADVEAKIDVYAVKTSEGEKVLSYEAAEALMRETWLDLMDIEQADLLTQLRLIDLDKNGQIESSEFIQATLHQFRNFEAKKNPEKKIRAIVTELYDRFDTDRSGTLNLDEMLKLFGNNQDFSACEFFKEMDASGDNEVSQAEFIQYVMPGFQTQNSGSGHGHGHGHGHA